MGGHPPGAFTAVAASATAQYDHDHDLYVEASALLPLPAAVLVHLGHDLDSRAVAVAVPTYRDGVLRVDGVFATPSTSNANWNPGIGDGWTLTRTGRVRGVSINARMNEFHRGLAGRITSGVLVAVDLVPPGSRPMDPEARIEGVVAGDQLTPAQRQTQRLFDQYLANPRNPDGRALFMNADRGADALDVLAPIVAPLRAERAIAGAGPERNSAERTGVEHAQGADIDGDAAGSAIGPPVVGHRPSRRVPVRQLTDLKDLKDWGRNAS